MVFLCRNQLVTYSAAKGEDPAKSKALFSAKHFKMMTFAVAGEGIADDKITGVLADQSLKDPHLCLFRIETPSTKSAGLITKVEAKLENKANKASFEKSLGEPLKFGMQVQMMHCHSQRFLSLNLMTAAATPGAWSVSVSPPSELLSRKISLLPFNRSHNLGDAIKCDEPLSLVFQTDNLRYYLQADLGGPERLEIHSTHKPASWKFLRYENFDESLESIKFGVPLVIKYSKLGVLMSLKKEKQKAQSLGKSMMKSGVGESMRKAPRDVIVTKADIDDYSNFWTLQNLNILKGGCSLWGSKFYLKNALTNEFIGPSLELQPTFDPSFYFTFPKPDAFRDDSLIPYGYPLLLKSSDGRILSLDQKKTNEEALDHLVPVRLVESAYDSGDINVTLEALGVDKRESLFEIDAVHRSATRFFNLIKGLLPKFFDIRQRLNEFAAMKDEEGRKVWEAAEIIQKKLETMLLAIKYVLQYFRDSSGEELQVNQRIFTGLKFHAVLIDIASTLHYTFGPESVHGASSLAYEQLFPLANQDVEVLWDLQMDAILENYHAAKLMAEHQIKLCELLKFDTRRIGALLTEVFRLVDPEIKDPKSFYREWCSRLETLGRKNLTEQVIYIKIIRNLCEIGDSGVLEYQREVTWQLFNSDIAFNIIQFTFYQGEPAIHFGHKGTAMGVTEFNIRNPDLAPLFHEDPEGKMVILMKDLSTLPDYVEYVQAALMLYHCICRGKCHQAVELVGTRLGLSLPTIFTVSQDLTVHIDIRQACMFLLEALCVTAPPFEPYTETDTSFNYALLKVEESKQERTEMLLIEYFPDYPYISKIMKAVFDFWMQRELPKCIDVEGFLGPLNYLKAMLRVTLAEVLYQHCNELYFNFVLRVMHFLLAGFTEGAAAGKKVHWSTLLISNAVKESSKDRKLELLVNDLLGCVLTTIIAIKKMSRRTLLTQVVRLLISKPSVFKMTLFGAGIGTSDSAEEVTVGLKNILDPGRQIKMMLDYCKKIVKLKNKKDSPDTALMRGATEILQTGYEPEYDFKDIVTEAPSIKEVFIRVILEWFSFSSFLKDRMLEVMDEIFKEKELFVKCFKYVDVYALGPISEVYTRIRWLRENSEINSLIIRARYECSMSSKSTSLARIGNILEYIINFIHPNTCVSDFILRKTQNIIRHQELHKDLYKLWGLVHFLDRIGKGQDSPAVRLKSAFTSFLYFFARGNTKNVKELARMLQPQHYILSIAQYPALLRLINDYVHLNVRDFTRLLVFTLEEAQASDKNLCMMNFIENIIIDRYGGKKRTIQNVVSTMLSEKVAEGLRQFRDRPAYLARLVKGLALSAEDNPPVIAQCRYMMPLSRLQDLILKEDSPEMLSSFLYFLNAVYIRKTKDIKTIDKVEDIKEILLKILKMAEEMMKEPRDLIQLVVDGSYPIVFFTRTPAYTEIHLNNPGNSELIRKWSFLIYEWDSMASGVLTLIPGILEAVALDFSVQRGLLSFFHGLCECQLKIKQMSERLDGMVNFSRILHFLQDAGDRVEKALHNFGVSDTQPAFQQLLCEVSDTDVNNLRDILSRAFQFPLVSPQEIEVDEEAGKVVKAGFAHYKKISGGEDEGEYITAFVNLIDKRLANGELTGRKEIIEASPGLLRKIRRLQRLFTTSKQRTFFFHILEGIVPKEELLPVKIMLNPMFLEAEVTNYGLNAVMRNESPDEVNAALQFLRKLFLMQTREFMDKFRELLDEGSLAYPLFMQIQRELDLVKASILVKAKEQAVEVDDKKKKEVPRNLGLIVKLAAASKTKESPGATATKQQQMVINMLLFIQICCDNCNESFQVFFRTQQNKEGKADVDMVLGLTVYLIETRVAKNYLIQNKAVFQVLTAAMSALVDFVTGPCVSNQSYLGNNVHVYLVMNTLISVCQGKEDAGVIEIHNLALQFLNTLLEGHPDPEIPKTMGRFMDLNMLRTGIERVFDTKVKGFERFISLQSDDITKEHKGVVNNTLCQCIILVKLKNMGVIHDELNKFEGTIAEPTPTYAYFSRYIGYVEIDRNGDLEVNFYPIPWKCKYITPTTRLAIIQEVNRSSHQEKLEDFMHMVQLCLMEMNHQQFLYRFESFKKMSERWQLFGRISYYIALTINMTLLGSIKEPDFSDLKANIVAFSMVAFLGIAQIIAYMACFFFNLIEYYPQAIMNKRKEKELEMHEFPAISDSDAQTMLRTHYLLQGHKKKTYQEQLQEKLQAVLLNFDLYYTYSYFMISMIAVYEPVFYPWILLDMIKQTPELGNVLKSVTQNFRQLILTMWLGVILIYLFTIVSFVYYKGYYEGDNLYCHDLWNCFFSTLNMGIRSGGGVGDVLVTPEVGDYWLRMVFDLLFYMLIIIILLNIIFGIIIDTFAELRDGRSHILNDILTVCYVCGTERSIIEMKGTGWSYHFMCEHSPFAYLSFFIYITEKKMYDCSGIEKHVKERFQKSDSSFMPTTSIAMLVRDSGAKAEGE